MSSTASTFMSDSDLSSPWGGLEFFSKAVSSSSSELSSHHDSSASDSPTLSKNGHKTYGDIRHDFKQGKVVAHSLYVDNIKVVQTQQNFMKDSGAYELRQAKSSDVELSHVRGYALGERLSTNKTTSSVYRAQGDTPVLIKVSDLSFSDHVARFLNDWYATLGICPPSPSHQSWLAALGPEQRLHEPDTPCKPVSLPTNIPGILYPVDQFSFEHTLQGTLKVLMAMVYPDHNYKSLLEFYSELVKEASETKVLESIYSAPSEPVGSDNASLHLELSAARNNEVDFVELSNQVKQIPRSRTIIASILADFVPVLRALAACHKHGIVHNGLTSSNILRSTLLPENDERRVVLTGWDFCFSVAVEYSFNSFRNKNYHNVQNGLQFVSPENTSGATTSVDYRTDIYSLGVCFYEMIVGCLPFQTSNLTELKRVVLTKSPIRPKTLGSKWITSKLDKFIMKCLEKNPSKRYQSINEMLAELNSIILEYSKKGPVGSLQEIPETHETHAAEPKLPLFHNSILNSTLVDTTDLKQKLFSKYHGPEKCKFILLEGDGGVGKATLLEQLSGEAMRRQDLVVHWRFDCSDRNVAKYAFLVYGVYVATKQILSSSHATIEEWRKIFTYEIDADLSVLFHSVPTLKILLGPKYQEHRQNRLEIQEMQAKLSVQPSDTIIAIIKEEIDAYDSSSMSSHESNDIPLEEEKLNVELKYDHIFKRIFSVLARAGLTLIMDNVNWLPVNEFNLLVEILEYAELSVSNTAVSLVASYNPGKASTRLENAGVDADYFHRVAAALRWPISVFKMELLGRRDFGRYFNLFHDNKKQSVDAVHKVVKGNFLAFEYFMRSALLKCHLYSDLLQECVQTANGKYPESMNDIIRDYLRVALTPDALRLLKFATIICTNGSFNICELMIVTGYSLKAVHSLLQLCLNTRVIVSSGICYKVPFHMTTEDEFPFELNDSVIFELTKKSRYRFDHSCIQLYLLKQMEENDEYQGLQRTCGLRFQKHLSKTPKIHVTAYLCMASHLLASCGVAKSSDTRAYHEALINGGRYAISTSNLNLALKFFDASMNFISKKDRRRNLKLILSRIQCNYYLGNYEETIRILEQAEADYGANNWTLLHLSVCSLLSLKKYNEGLKKALKGLESLKIEFSLDPMEAKKLAKKHMSLLPLSLSEIRKLKTLDKAWDKRFILIAELVTSIMNVTYILELPDLRLVMLAQLVNLMSTYGYTTSCGVPLLHLANHFVQYHDDVSLVKASELSDVAMSLVTNDDEASTQAIQTINETFLLYMAQFKMPLPRIIKRLSYVSLPSQIQLNNSFIKSWIMCSQLFLGNMRGWHSSSLGLGRQVRYDNEFEHKLQSNLMGLWCDNILYEEYMQLSKNKERLTPDLEFVYYANALLYACYEEDFPACTDLIINKTFEVLKQLPMSPLHLLYYFLSAITLVHDEEVQKNPEAMKIAYDIKARFKLWSELSSFNFSCEYKIIEACLHTLDQSFPSLTLLDMFEEVIEESENSKKWLEAGIASRICANWLRQNSQSEKRVRFYARKAFSLFNTVMAAKKVEMLKVEFPGFFDDFNWAGVKVNEEASPIQQNFFDDCFYTESPDDKSKSSRLTDPSDNSIMSAQSEKEYYACKKIQPPSQSEWTKTLKLCLFIAQSSSIDLIVQKLLESSLMFSGVDYGVVVLKMLTPQPVIKAIGTINSIYVLENESLLTRGDLAPSTLILQSLMTGETVHSHVDGLPCDDPYYIGNPKSSGFCVPIQTSTVVGSIYLENRGLGRSKGTPVLSVDPAVIDLLQLLCSQAAVSFTKSAVYTQMEVAKRAAEDATEEKASFLANMSHEIRTPFNSLFACSIFLLDTELDNIQREYVETIKNSALVTLNIIDGILAFTKIEHGSYNLESAPFPINDTIESAISFASEQTESEQLEFAYFNNCPQLETIYGDATRIRQIIINLVGNALKFTSVGHVKVTLEATLIKDKRYEFSLSVEDTGIGIPEDSNSKIFGAFTQADGSSRRVYGGSGLGLAISKKLAEIMNGKITFTSKENSGSTFVFKCPFEAELSKDPMDYPAQNAVIVSKKTWKKRALKQVLEYYNAKVTMYDDAKALQAHEGSVDVLVVGRECLKEAEDVLSLPRWQDVRLHILTRFGLMVSDEDVEKFNPNTILFSPIKRSAVKKILLDKSKTPLSLQRSPSKTVKVEAKPAQVDNLKILIAEDNMVNLVVALQHLKKLGYVADHAKNGVEALEKCEARLKQGEKYDVIFMDIQMPKKDGIQATIELKESLALRGLEKFFPKIIALTANVAGEERERCLEAGMVDFVSKPILPELLKKALAKVKQSMHET